MKMRRQLQSIFATLAMSTAHVFAAAPIGVSPSDSLSIRTAQGGSRVSATQPAAMPSMSVDVTRMLLALVIVIGLIYLARWILKRFYSGASMPGGSRAVQVLNRTILAPKQQVMLLQIGRRVVVVGESNGNMTTLAQIDDPDEIAQLVGRLHDERSGKSAAFGGLFGRAQAKMSEDLSDEDAARPLPSTESTRDTDEVKSDLSGLLEKVRSIRGQMGRD